MRQSISYEGTFFVGEETKSFLLLSMQAYITSLRISVAPLCNLSKRNPGYDVGLSFLCDEHLDAPLLHGGNQWPVKKLFLSFAASFLWSGWLPGGSYLTWLQFFFSFSQERTSFYIDASFKFLSWSKFDRNSSNIFFPRLVCLKINLPFELPFSSHLSIAPIQLSFQLIFPSMTFAWK